MLGLPQVLVVVPGGNGASTLAVVVAVIPIARNRIVRILIIVLCQPHRFNGREGSTDLMVESKGTMTETANDPGAAALRLEFQLCFPLYAASNLLTRLYRPALDEIGLTYPQYLVMIVLWENDQQSVSEIGARLHLDSGTLTPLLKRMETNGLVRRQRDVADERRVIVSLTQKGDDLKIPARRVPESMLNNPALTPCEGEALRSIARKLVGNLADRPELARVK